MALQRYCRRLARNRHTWRVSADRVAKPAAHTRAESRGSRLPKADAGERLTLCWREVDSNPRSLSLDSPGGEGAEVDQGGRERHRPLSLGGPAVRIPLPPPASP